MAMAGIVSPEEAATLLKRQLKVWGPQAWDHHAASAAAAAAAAAHHQQHPYSAYGCFLQVWTPPGATSPQSASMQSPPGPGSGSGSGSLSPPGLLRPAIHGHNPWTGSLNFTPRTESPEKNSQLSSSSSSSSPPTLPKTKAKFDFTKLAESATKKEEDEVDEEMLEGQRRAAMALATAAAAAAHQHHHQQHHQQARQHLHPWHLLGLPAMATPELMRRVRCRTR